MNVIDLLDVIAGREHVKVEVIEKDSVTHISGLAKDLLHDKRLEGVVASGMMHEVQDFDFTKVSLMILCYRK